MNSTSNRNILLAAGCVLACLFGGMVSGLVSGDSMNIYGTLNLPELQPPGYVFPIAWTILYILMGLALYLVWKSDGGERRIALALFAAQFAVNLCWTPIFFLYRQYLLAFIWILALWILVVATAYLFWRLDRRAGYLMVPYVLWVSFASYLSYSVYVLN